MSWIIYAAPFLVALIGGVGLKFLTSPERAARWSGVAVGAGVLLGWQLLVDPAWAPKTAHDRIGHMVLGAILIGTALDTIVARPLWRGILLGGFVVGCAWLSVAGGIAVRAAPSLMALIGGLALAGAWLGTILKFEVLRGHAATAQTIGVVLLGAVCAIATTVGDAVVAKSSLGALSAWLGHVVANRVFGLPVTWAALLPVLAVLFGGAWAVSASHSAAIAGFAVALLALFADRTARRIPMPGGRISDIFYVLALAGMAAIPATLAVIIVAARHNP